VGSAQAATPTVFGDYNLVQEDATKSRIMAIDDYGFQVRTWTKECALTYAFHERERRLLAQHDTALAHLCLLAIISFALVILLATQPADRPK